MNKKFLFYDDYSEGAHKNVIAALAENSVEQGIGYGKDHHTIRATDVIREAIGQSGAKVSFVASGTLANLVCIGSMLKSFESVISETNGHINVHEAGAIEAIGHKINYVNGVDGKLNCAAIKAVLDAHHPVQMVRPKLVYISQPTELGTIYSKRELEQIGQFCRENKLYLYLDGARLANALASTEADFDLKSIAANCDIFYIGGTKNGGLMGEAVVIVNPELQADFDYHLRQRGALLAKARSVSTQFIVLFHKQLYLDIAKHSNLMAQKLASGLEKLGITLERKTSTNQIFPVMANSLIQSLELRYGFHIWSQADKPNHSVIRLVTSWSTPEHEIDSFLEYVAELTCSQH